MAQYVFFFFSNRSDRLICLVSGHQGWGSHWLPCSISPKNSFINENMKGNLPFFCSLFCPSDRKNIFSSDAIFSNLRLEEGTKGLKQI